MKSPSILFHCADPRLGKQLSERDDDLLRAFERACDAAIGASASVMLVSGQLLAAGAPAPSALAAIEHTLHRLRDAGTTLVTTVEYEQRGWLDYLAAQQLCTVLAVRRDGEIDLPVAEPSAHLRIIGLGKPADRNQLIARTGRIRSRSRATSIALVEATIGNGPGFVTEDDVLTLTESVDYVALGGSRHRVMVSDRARDPGPLARADFSHENEPCGLLISARGSEVEVSVTPIEDRPVVVVELESSASVAAIEKALRQSIRGRKAKRPLLRIDRVGDDPRVADEQLLRIVRTVVDPVAWELRGGAETDSRRDATRVAVEQRVLARLAEGRDAGFATLAGAVLNTLMTDPNQVERAADAIIAYVTTNEPAGSPS